MNTSGFAQLRRGLLDHLTSGKMPVLYLSPYVILQMAASPETGIVYTNARILEVTFSYSSRFIRRALETLESSHYIKRFSTPGSSKPYPVLIHKFLCTVGANSGKYLNAIDTIDIDNPIYVVGELGASMGRARGELGASSNKPKYRSRDLRLENRDLRTRAHKTRQLPPSCGNPTEKPKKTSPDVTSNRAAYGRAGRLIPEAISILSRAKAVGSNMTGADVKEELKQWAADAGVDYDSESVRRAIDVAERRTKT